MDNPDRLIEMVEISGAESTDMSAPENVVELSEKCREAADNWSVSAENLWRRQYASSKKKSCVECGCQKKFTKNSFNKQ